MRTPFVTELPYLTRGLFLGFSHAPAALANFFDTNTDTRCFYTLFKKSNRQTRRKVQFADMQIHDNSKGKVALDDITLLGIVVWSVTEMPFLFHYFDSALCKWGWIFHKELYFGAANAFRCIWSTDNNCPYCICAQNFNFVAASAPQVWKGRWCKQDQILKTKIKITRPRPKPRPPEVNKGTSRI